MLLIAGVAAMVTAGPIAIAGTGGDVDTLEKLWPGVRDSTEEVFISSDPNVTAWGEGSARRVRTVVAPVEAPWLGQHVLYLEEFLHDDPESIRRQLLLDLQPAEPPAVGVRVRLYSFKEPRRWIHLDRRPKLISDLHRAEVVKAEGCDLMLKKEGDQFSGGTVGRDCIDIRDGGLRYVEYRLVVGEDLYWYRRRVLLRKGNDLQEEVFGFNWFELNDARLFACRVEWSVTGRKSDLRLLARLELHDQGGRAHFATPDGRKLELTLHSQDWPFMADRDALILLLQDQVQNTPMASAWTEIDSDDIAINLGWLRIQCGSMVPQRDELLASR
ncbi:MAG: hypothetical protein JWO04_2622 [Gammaproteobacteria bacterium]|nr:hypothetical protein [Gammaproteobacteria bacterium]